MGEKNHILLPLKEKDTSEVTAQYKTNLNSTKGTQAGDHCKRLLPNF